MDEHPDQAETPTAADAEAVRTGVPSVDGVITAVEQLEQRPLEEHVGVFETAHTALRQALDEPADPA